MSQKRILRKVGRLDYKILAQTGEKVFKGCQDNFSNMDALIEKETKLVCKLSRFMKDYEIGLLSDIADFQEGILELQRSMRKYT